MILCYLGGIGSGKTVSIVKEIVDSAKLGSYPVTNFNLSLIEHYRLKMEDLIKIDVIEPDEGSRRKAREIKSVNWVFWDTFRRKHDKFSIFLDEAHNFIHSRSSMSSTNILMSKWVSQARKILNDSKESHLFLVTQTIRKIDVDFRELAEYFIDCALVRGKSGRVYVMQTFFHRYENYLYRIKCFRRIVRVDNYFKFYNTREMVTFEDAEVYI